MLEFSDPALVYFMQRNRIEVVQFFPALPNDGDEVGCFELLQVLRNRLASHLHVFAQCGQGLAVLLVQHIKQTPAAGISQRFKYFVDVQWRFFGSG